jgi:lambda family phage portal protein
MSLAKTITVGDRVIDIPITLMDRFVNWRNPILGAERYRARVRMAISGGYTAADRTRRANQKGHRREMDAATAILPDLISLREESQEMYRNNPIAGGAINLNITKVVGRGLTVKSQVDREVLKLDDLGADAWERAAEREFALATETREIDAERALTFSLLQAMAFLKVLEDGDVLVNLPRFPRPGSPYKLKLQLIEAARLCNPQFSADTDKLCGGVAFDGYGAPETYHVLNRHPGNRRTMQGQGLDWSPLKAFDTAGHPLALHLFDKKRPGQPRGVPYLTPVVELIKQLGRYTDAEVMAAVVTGMLTAVVYSESGTPDFGPAPTADNPDGDPTKQDDPTGLELGYGSVIGLPDGKRIETVASNRPNVAFDPFVVAILRQIGMALELPFEVLVKHFTSSYSAARGALEEAWDYFLRRRHWLATTLCQPIYEAVITEAILAGRLPTPGFFADHGIRKAWLGTIWQGDAPSSLDPVKEIEAAKRRIELRISTRTEERSRLIGGDWERAVPQMEREDNLLKEKGLLVTVESGQPVPVIDQENDDPDQKDKDNAAA